MQDKQLFIKIQEKNRSCAFTGHRDLGADFSLRKLKNVIKDCIKQGVIEFYNGLAVGFDLAAAECVLAFKKKFPFISLIACIPCPNQEKYFCEKDKQRYAQILQQVDEYILLSSQYYNGCMQERNAYMADKADMMIAYCKKQTGGTAYTVKYFTKKYPQKEIIYL